MSKQWFRDFLVARSGSSRLLAAAALAHSACGGVYEAAAPDELPVVQAALWPDALRQGSGPLMTALLLDLPDDAAWQLTSFSVDGEVEVFSLRPPDDPDCQAALSAGVAVPARFVERAPQRLCIRLQPSPLAGPGAWQLRLTLTVDGAPRLASATAFILSALRP